MDYIFNIIAAMCLNSDVLQKNSSACVRYMVNCVSEAKPGYENQRLSECIKRYEEPHRNDRRV